jgi:hypothetical protein
MPLLCLLPVSLLLGFCFSPEDESDIFLRNVDGISADFTALSEDESFQSYISSPE